MGKKISKKVASASEPLKKKIKRQNTMEATAKEGKALISTLDKQNKKKKEEQKKTLENTKSVTASKSVPKKAAKAVKSTQKKTSAKPAKKDSKKPKAAPAKKSKKVDKKPTPPPVSKAPKKTASSIKKKSSTAAPTPTSHPDVSDKGIAVPVPVIEKKEVAPAAAAPTSFSFSFPFTGTSYSDQVLQKDIDSCSSIASTQQVKTEKLGLQIIKRSLKGVAVAKPEEDEKKGKILRTKTGDRLAAGMVDIVFCCDTTSSMGSYLTQCKSTVNTIIKHILDKTQSEGISVKFGFVAYRDHPPQDKTYLTCSYDLTTDEEIKQFIESLSAFGGGDYPEAVMDGLYVSAKHMSWRDSTYIPSLRYIFHIADAPPHGAEYSTDFFPILGDKGCACEMDINKISHIINMKQIHYRFISADNMKGTKKMAEIFKEKMVNYEECSISNAADMDIRISDMIIRELLPDMVEEE